MTELLNHEAVCRTAPATPALLNITYRIPLNLLKCMNNSIITYVLHAVLLVINKFTL